MVGYGRGGRVGEVGVQEGGRADEEFADASCRVGGRVGWGC